jgi:hypothetical protein
MRSDGASGDAVVHDATNTNIHNTTNRDNRDNVRRGR